MKNIERLAEMAARRSDPLPLDAGGIMARIRDLEPVEDVAPLPIRFFAGGAAVAAAVAIAVTAIAATAWSEMADPFTAMTSLLDVMDVML